MLDTLEAKNVEIFEEPLKLEPMNADLKRKIEIYKQSGLSSQVTNIQYQQRITQANQLFTPITLEKAISWMTRDEPPFNFYIASGWQRYEWLYNHNKQKTMGIGDYEGTQRYTNCVKTKWLKRFWHYTIGSLFAYTEEIPLGIVLRIEEMKKLNLFNRFLLIAPTEKFRIIFEDPIVVASIEKECFRAPSINPDEFRYYFVGKWG